MKILFTGVPAPMAAQAARRRAQQDRAAGPPRPPYGICPQFLRRIGVKS